MTWNERKTCQLIQGHALKWLTDQRFTIPKGTMNQDARASLCSSQSAAGTPFKIGPLARSAATPIRLSEMARTALLGSRTENEPSAELLSECPAQAPKGWVVSTNSIVELNDGTSAPTGNLRLTRGAVVASRSEVTP